MGILGRRDRQAWQLIGAQGPRAVAIVRPGGQGRTRGHARNGDGQRFRAIQVGQLRAHVQGDGRVFQTLRVLSGEHRSGRGGVTRPRIRVLSVLFGFFALAQADAFARAEPIRPSVVFSGRAFADVRAFTVQAIGRKVAGRFIPCCGLETAVRAVTGGVRFDRDGNVVAFGVVFIDLDANAVQIFGLQGDGAVGVAHAEGNLAIPDAVQRHLLVGRVG